MAKPPRGAMSSPFTGSAGSFGHFDVVNTDEVKANPFTEVELAKIMDKLSTIGILKAKNNNVIIFECEGMLLKLGKN